MRIVVGVDGSPGAQRALEWAVAEGRARGVEIAAVLAYGYYGRPFDVQIRTGGRDPEGLDVAARGVLSETVELLPPSRERVSIRELVCDDEPVDALLSEVTRDDMLVVGARGLGPVRRLLLGSVSLHCVRHALCPTVIVRDRPLERDAPSRPVVVGVDGSPESATALHWAAEHARVRELPLRVVHAWSLAQTQPDRVDDLFHVTEQRDRSRREIERMLDAVVAADQRSSTVISLLDGNPVEVLLEAAEDAGLLVVGSRGEGGIARLLLGSTSAACLQHAVCDVAVVPQLNGNAS
jgi:nucleotide-binding universal stress UspA family protein